MNEIRVLYVGTLPGFWQECTMENELKAMQAAVGGNIETMSLPGLREHGILLIVNEGGLLGGLDYNKNLRPFFFVGPVFFVAVDGEEFTSLTEDQVDVIAEFFHLKP